jgi:hypothetical protein
MNHKNPTTIVTSFSIYTLVSWHTSQLPGQKHCVDNKAETKTHLANDYK